MSNHVTSSQVKYTCTSIPQFSLPAFGGIAGHPGKVTVGVDDKNESDWMAAGDGPVLIGATILVVLKGVVCE